MLTNARVRGPWCIGIEMGTSFEGGGGSVRANGRARLDLRGGLEGFDFPLMGSKMGVETRSRSESIVPPGWTGEWARGSKAVLSAWRLSGVGSTGVRSIGEWGDRVSGLGTCASLHSRTIFLSFWTMICGGVRGAGAEPTTYDCIGFGGEHGALPEGIEPACKLAAEEAVGQKVDLEKGREPVAKGDECADADNTADGFVLCAGGGLEGPVEAAYQEVGEVVWRDIGAVREEKVEEGVVVEFAGELCDPALDGGRHHDALVGIAVVGCAGLGLCNLAAADGDDRVARGLEVAKDDKAGVVFGDSRRGGGEAGGGRVVGLEQDVEGGQTAECLEDLEYTGRVFEQRGRVCRVGGPFKRPAALEAGARERLCVEDPAAKGKCAGLELEKRALADGPWLAGDVYSNVNIIIMITL